MGRIWSSAYYSLDIVVVFVLALLGEEGEGGFASGFTD